MRPVDADAILNTFCDDCPNRAYCEDRESKCSGYSDIEEVLTNAPTVEITDKEQHPDICCCTCRLMSVTYGERKNRFKNTYHCDYYGKYTELSHYCPKYRVSPDAITDSEKKELHDMKFHVQDKREVVTDYG